MVYKVEGGIKLDLAALNNQPVGRRYIKIADPTWIPRIGMYVDGGGEELTIQLVDDVQNKDMHVYFRPSDGWVYENFNGAPLLQMAYWHQYGRARGAVKP